MPVENGFRHQSYSREKPVGDYEVMTAQYPPQMGSAAYLHQMGSVAKRVSDKVDSVYLIHGTFAGNDALGWTAQFEKLWPRGAEQLKVLGKKLFDVLADDNGNFTEAYARQLADGFLGIPIRRFLWSGENNHVGRAIAAVELMGQLFDSIYSEANILLCCHSHAGNILAMVSHLLGGQESQREQFFKILGPVFRSESDRTLLTKVQNLLGDASLRQRLNLNIVTMGTPIRYGWERNGYQNLLHFVYHVPREGSPEYLSPVPEKLSADLLKLEGDFVQQFGIAGTNFFPYLLDLPLVLAEQKLGKWLQPFGRSDFWEHLRMGMRVAEEGLTLLVDYEDKHGLAKSLAGHGVYSQQEWMAFHFEEISRRFYA